MSAEIGGHGSRVIDQKSVSGPISSVLTNRFGCRSVTWTGTIIASCGLALTSMSTRLWHLGTTFTLLGVGAGLAYIPGSVVIVCEYFERRRPLALALASCGVGVGTFIVPPLIRGLINAYHWRGACLVLAGIVLNMGVFASLYAPVRRRDTGVDQAPTGGPRKVIRVKMLRQLPFGCLLLNNVLVMYGKTALFIHLPSYLETVGFSTDAAAGFVSAIGVAILIGRVGCGLIAQHVQAVDVIYVATMAMAGMLVAMLPYARLFETLLTLCIFFGFTVCTLGPLLPLIATEMVGIEALSDAFGYLMVAEGIGSLMGPPIAGTERVYVHKYGDDELDVFSGFLYDTTQSYGISMGSSGLAFVLSSVAMIPAMYRTRRAGRGVVKEKGTDNTARLACEIA